jgi:hypothetical protein
VTTDAIKALATIEDALPALANAIAQAAATDRVKADHRAVCEQIAAMHAAAVGEVRAPLLGYVEDVASVRHAFEAQRARADTLDRLCRQHRQRADDVEQRLAEHRRRLAAVLAKPADTPLDELTEYAARTLTRNGERLLAAEADAKQAEADRNKVREARNKWARQADAEILGHRQRADRADATLQRVRDAETLADALAAVAEHDGLTPDAARATANIAAAAEAPAAIDAERDRAHAIALAEANRRADNAWACAYKAEATLARISDARQSADVWTAIGMHYGWTPEQAGQAARTRRTTDERHAEQRAEAARRISEEQAADAARFRAAWHSARHRAARRTEQPVSVVRFEASAIADQIDDAIRRAFRAHRTR